MEIVRDMFGSELFVGDSVVYADSDIETSAVSLWLYQIVDITDGVVKGLVCSGAWIDNIFYLSDPDTRCARIRNPFKSAELKDMTLLS